MKVNIGKNTIGDNDKMSVNLREYGRSTHDLSFAFRSTMGVGTLVPSLKLLALPGDTFTITADSKIMTHPTIGPLFGSFKFQTDIFTCPIRLYNAMLHNNALNVGMDMSKVKLPKISLGTPNSKTDSSSLLNYFGIKSMVNKPIKNAVPILAYYDIFKNYYANKQEDNFYFINSVINTEEPEASMEIKIKILSAVDVLTYSTVAVELNTTANPSSILRKDSTLHIQVGSAQGFIYLNQSSIKLYKGNNERLIVEVGANTVISNFTGGTSLPIQEGMVDGANLKVFNDLEISAQKLESIDTLREDILSKGRNEYIIGDGEGVNCQVEWLNNLVTMQNTPLAGLCLKTHFSDVFNNWVKTEWVDGDNGISALTAIDTSQGSFTIDTLNLAQKVYNLLNRIAVSGGSYKDWIETVYTTDYYFRAESPIYEGGMSCEINFEEVVSNAATEIEGNEPLGTLAGKGVDSNKKGGTVVIKVNEPSYIIAISSITPRIDYSQGNEWDMDLDTLNDLHKPQLDGIGYQDLLGEWMEAETVTQSIGKTVAWINYMTNYNKTFGNFAAGESEGYMCLNRTYELDANQEITNATTYINPKEFTGVFATNMLDNQDFWVQIGWGIEARRVMSAKQIPLM